MFALPSTQELAVGHRARLVPTADFKKSTLEVPLAISKRFRDVKFKTLVGLSCLVPCAWYAVDDTLCIWRFRGEDSTVTIQCDGVITSVAIGVPSPFVFDASVKFLVVIATENSVSLHGMDSEGKLAKLGAGYFIPVPGKGIATFTQASITATGRIMLWSPQDMSSLYELRYAAHSSWFRSKLFFHTHSLILTSGAAGIVSSVLTKLLNSLFVSPRVSSSPPESSVRLFIHPDNSFRYFVSVDSSNISLHEMTPSPSALEMASGAWRHKPDSDLTIRVIGRTAIADLPSTTRILFASVVMEIDSSDEPRITVVSDSGIAHTLRNTESGILIVDKSVPVSPDLDAGKRQRVSFGSQTTLSGVSGAFSAGFESNGFFAAGQGTRLTVANAGEVETNGSILAIGIERQVQQDRYSPLVLPAFTSRALATPTPQQSLIVLTGKGVTILDPPDVSERPLVPSSVQQVVNILTSKNPSVIFAYKPMFVRAISDDVSVASLETERDFADRESLVQPLKGGLWIGGVKKFADSLTYVVKHQPLFVSGSCVGPSALVLESAAVQMRNLVKFIHQVVHAAGLDRSSLEDHPVGKGYQRREFMQTFSRERAAKQQAVVALLQIADELSELGEVTGFLAVLADNPVQVDADPAWTINQISRPVLKQMCESVIAQNPSERMTSIIDKLRVVSPSILCSVSPAVVPFNAEGVAAMIHCAVAQKSPVQVLLEAVRTLGRNNPSISKTLNEISSLIRALPQDDTESKECVIGAALDGLQERLIDESAMLQVLAWAGSSLSANLNDFLLSYLFEHGNVVHIPAGASANSHVERFLVTRIGQDPIFGEVYAEVLERSGRAQQGAELLERLASTSAKSALTDRIRLLERAHKMNSTRKRLELLSIAKYIQLPLSERDEDLRWRLVNIADLYECASLAGVHDVVLKCFLFVSGKEQDLIRAWTNVLFADLRFFTRGGRSVPSGVVEFLEDLYEISQETQSFSIWRRPELIAAMIEYLFCMLHASSANVADEILVNIVKLSPQQVVEAYVKMLREMNVWSSVIPKVKGAEFVPPQPETLKSHLVDALVDFASKHRERMNRHKLQSLLILAKNYIQREHEGLNRLIDDELGVTHTGTLPGLAS